MSKYKVGDKVELSDAVYCGDGIGYINKVIERERLYQVTNQRPGTDDEFVWGAYVGEDEILRIVTHPSERTSEAPNIPERKSKYPMLVGITASGTFAGMMTHEATATIVDRVHDGEGRLVLTDELTYKLPNVHVALAIVAYITQLRTDLAVANERAERGWGSEREEGNPAKSVCSSHHCGRPDLGVFRTLSGAAPMG